MTFILFLFSLTNAFSKEDNCQKSYQDLNYQYAYLAMVGYGPGLGMLGHAFIVFTTELDKFVYPAYQYDVDLQGQNEEAGVGYFLSQHRSSKVKFGLTCYPYAHSLIQKYQKENRVVLLYRLDISTQQVKKLYQRMQHESQKLSTHPTPYDLTSNNCVTNAIRAVNSVVEEEKRIPVAENRTDFLPFIPSWPPHESLMHIPLTVTPVLSSLDLFPYAPIFFEPIEINDLERNLTLFRKLSIFQNVCQWKKEVWDFLVAANSRHEIRMSDSYLTFLVRKVSECSARFGKQELEELLKTTMLEYFMILRNRPSSDYDDEKLRKAEEKRRKLLDQRICPLSPIFCDT